ncbi:MAG: FAD-dependent oxidoreductase [Phycisphaerales bacterium]|nr:MAG: FAD-dependent oxidoreductase [Phycisphaerales bacterium]
MRIVIVGGVAAGASAATRARRLNEQAEIVVFEKGGAASFANCGMPYYVGHIIAERDKLLVMKPDAFGKEMRIDVRVRHEVKRIDREKKCVEVENLETGEKFEQPYDKLILATGARAIVPPIAGLDSTNVFQLRSLEDADAMRGYADEHKPKRAVIVGGGFIGLEAAEALRALDVEVHLVELLPQVMPQLDAEIAGMLIDPLNRHGVRLNLNDGLEGVDVTDGRVTAVTTKSGKRIETDMVLLSIGVRPNVKLAKEAGLELGPMGGIRVNAQMQTSDPDVLAAGDAVEVMHGVTGQTTLIPLAGPASRLGRLAGQFAATGNAPQAHRVLGTAVVKVFDRVVASTGLTEKAAAALRIEARSVMIRRPQHAGYYPGAKEMALKLVYEPGTRRMLGAQAFGEDGVDKRVDILATALYFGATIDDLCGLDLCYAPQFGAAKDPVHIAAQAACNQADGLVDMVQPAEVMRAPEAAGVLLDVRPAKMHAAGAIPGSMNIPLAQLRDRLDEVPDDRPVTVYCKVGQTSYVAARVLTGHGRKNVRSLNGGYSLYREVAENVKK